jgi:GNAT superfamily N-acetyltransferase
MRKMCIEYRTYEKGDGKDLADVFNISFQSLGGGLLRTPETVVWRYLKKPHGKASEINIAYDTQVKKIVGAVYCTLEKNIFGGQQYLSGAVNDVSVLPNNGGKGIARKLMEQACTFMETEGCEISVLCADPRGFPRSKLYVPMGWEDLVDQNIMFNFANFGTGIKYLPGFAPLYPASMLSRFMIRRNYLSAEKRAKLCNPINTITIQPSFEGKKYNFNFPNLSRHLLSFFNSIMPVQMNGAVHIDYEEWHHFRENPILKGLVPTYVVLFKDGKVIGFASFLRQWIYAAKLGIRFPLAFMREFVIDDRAVQDDHQRADLYTLLAGKIWEAATQRKCIAVIYNIDKNHTRLNRALKYLGFFSFSGSVYMVNYLNSSQIKSDITSQKKPINVNPSEYASFP